MKRENKLKRQKKEEKEREARRKAGLPERQEGYISPRQCRLGQFFGNGHAEIQARASRSNSPKRDKYHCDRDGDSNATMGEDGPNRPTSTPKDKASGNTPLQEVTLNRPCLTPHTPEKPSQPNCSRVLLDEYDWMALLPSNTQVQRELSTPPSNPNPPANPTGTTSSPSHQPPAMMSPANVEAMMAFISTQDLAYTTEELEDLVMPCKSKDQLDTSEDCFDFGEFRVSTQELLELSD